MMTLTAFFFHQIFELMDRLFQVCREMHGSKKNLWQNLRVTVNTLIFDSWSHLMDFMINRKQYEVVSLSINRGEVELVLTTPIVPHPFTY